MPRNVRNFWLELRVDGRSSVVEAGPRTKDGGFSLVIKIREKGSISDTWVRIYGYVEGKDLHLRHEKVVGGSIQAEKTMLIRKR